MIILNEEDQGRMRVAGQFNAQLMDEVRKLVKPGAILNDIDQFVHAYTVEHGNKPATLGYKGYPKSCCISINNVICHGIPDKYKLKDGDIVNIDLTSVVDGWHGDQSETFLIGEVDAESKRLVQCAFDAMHKGIDAIKPGGQVKDIGFAITGHANIRDFTVVRDYMGHGVGQKFHQAPHIPHYPHKQLGVVVIYPGVWAYHCSFGTNFGSSVSPV